MVFHPDCLALFAQALQYQLHGKCGTKPDLSIVDKDLLYAAMCKVTDHRLRALKLDYGELNHSSREQYWCGCTRGEEVSLSLLCLPPDLC